jgi:hypothetical protein
MDLLRDGVEEYGWGGVLVIALLVAATMLLRVARWWITLVRDRKKAGQKGDNPTPEAVPEIPLAPVPMTPPAKSAEELLQYRIARDLKVEDGDVLTQVHISKDGHVESSHVPQAIAPPPQPPPGVRVNLRKLRLEHEKLRSSTPDFTITDERPLPDAMAPIPRQVPYRVPGKVMGPDEAKDRIVSFEAYRARLDKEAAEYNGPRVKDEIDRAAAEMARKFLTPEKVAALKYEFRRDYPRDAEALDDEQLTTLVTYDYTKMVVAEARRMTASLVFYGPPGGTCAGAH